MWNNTFKKKKKFPENFVRLKQFARDYSIKGSGLRVLSFGL